ncbi:MAG: D-2-hydroxyacid dehydrogenase [Pedosphaera sp.]|nr:D-2-hydroxyacid dehydrogenase [Pedosphaera sp.]MST01261.1 D-2-hydroxyacid dehydrogenase [Pedosphaera sp.]
MNIVVLDGHTLNPGDLSWDALRALGTCSIHDRTAPDQIAPRARDAEILITNKTVLSRDTILQLPKLRFIGVLATGFNVVDTAAARERGVSVCNVPGYGTKSVAQLVMALLLELVHRTGHHAETVRAGRWSQSPDFCYWDYPLIELDGLTLGIVGYGRIGEAVAQVARAFGMKIIAQSRTPKKNESVTFVELDTLFREADIISLHCPLTPENKGLVNAARLALMKPTAFLINTARGPLINEPELAAALNSGRIAGAALDVLSVEPPPADHPLFTARNCILTPHIAWATRAARARLMETAVANLKAFLAGHPQNVVNL